MPSTHASVATGLLPALLLAQAIVGAFDTLVNHDLRARLPARADVAPELRLHALRELLYAALFGLAAWGLQPGVPTRGALALALAVIVVDLRDTVIEFRLRRIDAIERVTHAVLWANLGAIVLLLALLAWPAWAAWEVAPARAAGSRPAAAPPVLLAWPLAVAAVTGAGFALRDGWASLRPRRAARA